MADIFISYKSEERALPEALASDLRAAGYSVWWDVDLVGGAAFRAQILEKLNAARAVIVIWTPASVQSEFVLDEADHAKRDGKLIPVRVPELDPRAIPLGHGQTQACLLSDRPRILGALQAIGLCAQASTPSAPPLVAITADERLWQEVSAEKSLDAVLYYLRKFPNGPRAAEADDLIWDILSAENTVASYRRYLSCSRRVGTVRWRSFASSGWKKSAKQRSARPSWRNMRMRHSVWCAPSPGIRALSLRLPFPRTAARLRARAMTRRSSFGMPRTAGSCAPSPGMRALSGR